MVSSPPVEVGAMKDRGVALLSLTTVGNNHVEQNGHGGGSYLLDEWALRQLAKQAEAAADRLSEGGDE